MEATDRPVDELLDAKLPQAARRADADRLIELMQAATGEPPRVWGTSMVGFGSYHYRYASGHEGDAPLVAFAPQASRFSLHLTTEPAVRDDLLAQLGPHAAGAGCVYVKRLDQLDGAVLARLVEATVAFTRAQDVSRG